MINLKIFKANDIRGKYPEEINEKTVLEISKAISEAFSIQRLVFRRKIKLKIIIGRDARLSSLSLYKTVLSGLGHSNVLKNVRMKIIEAGIMTSPMLYFLVNKLKADGGIMVTASHNPKEYNGLKIVGKKAVPISGSEILRIMNNEL